MSKKPRSAARTDFETHMDQRNTCVGERIRECRILLGFSLQQLADMIGVSLQQAQKYEVGLSEISVGRFYTIAEALGMLHDIDYFFHEDGDKVVLESPMRVQQRELRENFIRIPQEDWQDTILQLSRVLACSKAIP